MLKTVRQFLIYIIGLSLLLGTVGCQSVQTDPNDSESVDQPQGHTETADQSEVVFIMHHDNQQEVAGNDYVGILSGLNGCIHISIPESPDINAPLIDYLAILPDNYTAVRQDNMIVLLDERSRAVGSIGEFIWIIGSIMEELPDDLDTTLPSYCSGPFIYVISAAAEIPF